MSTSKARAPVSALTMPGTISGDFGPKTPADEGIEFFESVVIEKGEPIHVYELRLDPDGGPNKDRSVEYTLSSFRRVKLRV